MFRVFLLFCFFISQHGFAQKVFSTLDDIISYAAENNVVYRQGKQTIQASEQDVQIQRSALLPRVGLFGTTDYYPVIPTQLIPESIFGGQDGKFRKVQFGLPMVMTAGAEISFPVLNFSKWTQLEKSKLQYEQQVWQRNTENENIRIQLTRLYYQELAMKSAIALNEQDKDISMKLMAIMQQRKDNGILDPADYNRSKNLELGVYLAGKEYERMLEDARIGIRTLLNLPDTVPMIIQDSLPDFSWPAASRDASDVEHRPAWQEINFRVLVSDKALEESKKAAWPSLGFYGKYVYNWQAKFKDDIHIGFDVSMIGVRLDVPVFQGGYYKSLQRKNAFLLESTKLEKEKIQFSLMQQQKEWKNQYLTAFGKHSILLEKTTIATDNLRIAGLNMREGIMEFNQFNEIFQEYNRTKLEYLQNLLDGVLYYRLLTQN